MIQLIQTPFVQLTGMPEGYEGEDLGVDEDTPGQSIDDSPLRWPQSHVFFKFKFVHNPGFSIYSHVLIAWGLNLVSFGQVRFSPLLHPSSAHFSVKIEPHNS
jgi:hypothetical protein